jgi:uncharacterized UBP type Zn finger protein
MVDVSVMTEGMPRITSRKAATSSQSTSRERQSLLLNECVQSNDFGDPRLLSGFQGESEEPPAKMTKLSIVEEREEDKYEHFTVVKCWACDSDKGLELPELSNDASVSGLSLFEGTRTDRGRL